VKVARVERGPGSLVFQWEEQMVTICEADQEMRILSLFRAGTRVFYGIKGPSPKSKSPRDQYLCI